MEEYVVTTDKLTKVFGSFTAVDSLTMNIRRGEIYGFLGPNGAGKSTAIRMLCGILEPTSGSGRVLGYDLVKDKMSGHQNSRSRACQLADNIKEQAPAGWADTTGRLIQKNYRRL